MLRRFRGVRAGSRNPEAKRGICPVQKETAPCYSHGAVIYVGDDLLSHTLSRAVQSALRGLTSVFGMGTGVSPAVRSPASLTWTTIPFRAKAARNGDPGKNRLVSHSVPGVGCTQNLSRRSCKELSSRLLGTADPSSA